MVKRKTKKESNLQLYVLLVFVAILAIASLYNFFSISNAIQTTNTKASGFKTISSGDTSEGNVAIDLTPRFSNNKLIVDIAANTHSVDLSQFDLLKIMALEYNGKTISPTSAPKLSGHHASGEIVFDVKEKLTSFKIMITGIPLQNKRIYNWEIK